MDVADAQLRSRPRGIRWGRALGFSAAIVLLVLLAAAVWFYSTLRTALPQIDGTLVIAGLNGRVDVIRDQHGVPTIRAGNLDDLFFAQGYVTAQDRLWEMDIARRASAGELAEVLG